MSESHPTESNPNRILVTLDTSARGRAALEAALRLALITSAEIQGLFVEDEDLVRLASLPFASEVDLASATPRALQTVSMERALRAAAEDAEQVFAKALAGIDLQWTFRIVRGTVTQASLAAAADVGLLVIGQQGRSPRIVASDYLTERATPAGRVVAIFDGSESAFRTLEVASSLADPSPYPLSVLVLTSDGDTATKQCVAWLQRQHIRAEVDQVLNPSHEAVAEFVRKWPPGVLLINRDSKFVSNSLICQLVNDFEGPLVLC